MLLNLCLQNFGYCLVSTRVEVIREHNLMQVCEIRVMADWGVQVKQHWQVHLLLRVQQLILEAETLDFVEVQGALLRENLVDSNSRDWLIRPVVHLIEGKGSLTSIHSQLLSFRLKVPRNVVLGLPAELDFVLTEYVDVLLFGAVVSRVLTHSEAECLAHNIVKWHS